MIAHQYAEWEKAQTQCRLWTRKEVRRFESEDPDSRGHWGRKDEFWRKAYIHCASYIAPVRVEE